MFLSQGGRHVDHVVDQIAKVLVDEYERKHKKKAAKKPEPKKGGKKGDTKPKPEKKTAGIKPFQVRPIFLLESLVAISVTTGDRSPVTIQNKCAFSNKNN